MIREQVISTSITIRQAGALRHFQVKLPKNTKRVIGIELGGRWLAETTGSSIVPPSEGIKETFASKGLVFKRNVLIGELKLQSCEETNLFYAGQLQLDNNASYSDFTNNKKWTATSYTHQATAFEEAAIVNGESTILQGIYKDRYGEQNNAAVNYLLNVYVWIEINEPLINCK